ncbi:hypothetical protein BLNAU_23619 [Blattamonas nauphoetae]|uniref:Uncharacterized protein n=1 Tax=Blattamonas nauphoetae TaxID=2049346 RepID=A0ABQ9WRU3_9EUKA|nr:hypothetical protein BLNAU_23619 [Blattamonas nauphoetae]
MTTSAVKISSYSDSPNSDCSAFLNWDEDPFESESEKAVVFRSLVATMRLQPALDDSQEVAAMKLLKYVTHGKVSSADAFLNSFGQAIDESSTSFVESIVVLLSTPSQAIIKAAMKMLNNFVISCSDTVGLALVKADLIPHLVITLNLLSLSFTDAVDIHINVMSIVRNSLWFATPFGLNELRIEDGNERHAVQETVLIQVLIPSEQYICHLCANRFLIIDGNQSVAFLKFLARLLEICPYYQPTMDFLLHMQVVLTIQSCLTFFENDESIYRFLDEMSDIQRKWNRTRGEERQMWKIIHRMLRMEGVEDVVEDKLQNDKSGDDEDILVATSIEWNNLLAMNLAEQE